jgi:tetratricopeptide (TPR) repeat protein
MNKVPRNLHGLGLGVLVGTLGIVVAVALNRTWRHREDATIALARARRAAGDRVGALKALLACAAKEPRACVCAEDAAELAIDLGRYPDALSAIAHSECAPSPRRIGVRAEVLVANGHATEAMRDAEQALAGDPGEVHACFARAWALGKGAEAKAFAQRAVDGGRGVPAILLLGALRLGEGDLVGARAAFEQAAHLAPDDARAAFDVALVAHREGRFHDAREGYLHALSLDANMADARYNLAVLTHSAGADDEARHNLEELERIAPSDPRIDALRQSLGGR